MKIVSDRWKLGELVEKQWEVRQKLCPAIKEDRRQRRDAECAEITPS